MTKVFESAHHGQRVRKRRWTPMGMRSPIRPPSSTPAAAHSTLPFTVLHADNANRTEARLNSGVTWVPPLKPVDGGEFWVPFDEEALASPNPEPQDEPDLSTDRPESEPDPQVLEFIPRVDNVFVGALKTLAQALEAKDPYTSGHSARVSSYATAIAWEMGLSAEEVEQIGLAGELHDIGKIGVPERLLHKDGPLTFEEYHEVMEHTVVGEKILKPLFHDYPIVLAIVRWHHERVDGRGLPDGLTGEELPMAAKIVAVADAFDAMTSARPYRSSRPMHVALAELGQEVEHQFDADVVAALTTVVPTCFGFVEGSRPEVGNALAGVG